MAPGKTALLIVNADDFNLTKGVSKAILEAHDTGIVTSTTVLVNLPMPALIRSQLLKRKSLGTGIHLNITLGRPVSPVFKVATLVGPDGNFKKRFDQIEDLPSALEVFLEWDSQVKTFIKIMGRTPTHFDTHHQMHDHPHFFEVLKDLSLKYRLPIRRCKLMKQKQPRSIMTSDYFWGNLKIQNFWKKVPLKERLKHLSSGVHEVMCHPGHADPDLRQISSFVEGREKEWELFRDPELKSWILKKGIRLIHYGYVILSHEAFI